MTDIVIEYYNDSYAQIITDMSIRQELIEYFSFFVENHKFNPKVKSGLWDGKIRLFGKEGLPLGLVDKCIDFANEYNYTISNKIDLKTNISKESFDTWLEQYPIYKSGTRIELHVEQYNSVYNMMKASRLLTSLPTSGGKSAIIGLCSKYYLDHNSKKVLILVPTTMLTNQMKENLIDYRLFNDSDILSISSGTEKDSSANIYVSTWQSATKMPKEWLDKFGMLIVDEVHLALGACLQNLNKNMTNCRYKFGLTGSLKDSKSNILQLVGLFGNVYKPTTTSKMISEGKISKINITPIVLNYSDEVKNQFKPKSVLVDNKRKLIKISYQDEIKWLINNPKRNNIISKLAIASEDKNTIVLFKEQAHGAVLYNLISELLKGTGRKCYYIDGLVKKSSREDIKHILEHRTGDILVASYGTLAAGVSIDNLSRAIFAHPTKSKIINVQSIGRILRIHEDKDCAYLYDFIDDMCSGKQQNYSYKHGIIRLELYVREHFPYTIKRINLI